MRKAVNAALFLIILVPGSHFLSAEPPLAPASPSVLVLYDGPDVDKNPGRLDALYLINLLGHFTTRRVVHPLETYQRGEWAKYDAVFAIVYQRRYRVPSLLLRISRAIPEPRWRTRERRCDAAPCPPQDESRSGNLSGSPAVHLTESDLSETQSGTITPSPARLLLPLPPDARQDTRQEAFLRNLLTIAEVLPRGQSFVVNDLILATTK